MLMTTKEKVKEIQDYIQRLNAEILYIREIGFWG